MGHSRGARPNDTWDATSPKHSKHTRRYIKRQRRVVRD